MAERKAKGVDTEYQRGRQDVIDAVLRILHSERDHNVIRRAVERLRHAGIAGA